MKQDVTVPSRSNLSCQQRRLFLKGPWQRGDVPSGQRDAVHSYPVSLDAEASNDGPKANRQSCYALVPKLRSKHCVLILCVLLQYRLHWRAALYYFAQAITCSSY